MSTISEELALSHPLAKVGDFGLSQFTPFQLRAIQDKGTMGHINPQWTAPEILRGQPYSVQADVYSLGLLLWEIKHRTMAYGNVGAGVFQYEKVKAHILSGGRPPVSAGDPYDNLCAECWVENPLF